MFLIRSLRASGAVEGRDEACLSWKKMRLKEEAKHASVPEDAVKEEANPVKVEDGDRTVCCSPLSVCILMPL